MLKSKSSWPCKIFSGDQFFFYRFIYCDKHLQVSRARQKICSKSNLSSGVHLDCWCDEWYPIILIPHSFMTQARSDEYLSWPSICLFVHEVCCQMLWFRFAARCWDNEQNCIFYKLALGGWCWALWRQPQLALRHRIGSSGWNPTSLKID